MGMPRLRHVPATLFLAIASLLAAACARAPAPDAQAPSAERATSVQPQAGYGQPMPGPYGAPAATSAPPSGGVLLPNFAEPPAVDLAGLQAQLDSAERALGLVLDAKSGADAAHVTKAPAAPGTPISTDPCQIACAALASMRRSAEHLCGMAGEKDAACGGARERVQRAEQRVTQACPACAGK